MFILTNFYFRQDEFLCSSLSFLENKVSIPRIKKCLFGMVKIVSVLLPTFTYKNGVEKKDFRTPTFIIPLYRSLSVPIREKS